MTPISSPERVVFVDSIRALAALYVVFHHFDLAVFGYPNNTGPPVLAPLLYGHFGVAAFIVVSGFSLGLAPAKRGWHIGNGGYWTFMRRRAWRIIPPYWAALALSVALLILLNTRIDDPVSWKGVASHFFLVQDVVPAKPPNAAFWSIAVEWQLYWIFPVLILVRRRLGPIVLTLAAVSVVVAVGLAHDHGGGVVAKGLLHLSPQMGALFVYGIVAASVMTRTAAGSRWLGFAAVITAGVLVAACARLGFARAEVNLYWLDLLAGIAVATLLAYLTARPSSWIRKALEWRPLVSTGQFSYSIYLIHEPLILVAWTFFVVPLGLTSGSAFTVMAGVVLPIIILCSHAFFRAIEKPFMDNRSWDELRASMSDFLRPRRSSPAGSSSE